MNTTIVPEVVVVCDPQANTAIPEKQLFWVGYDMFTECFLANDYLSPEEFAAMLPEEKRGYEYAQRCAADTETYAYLSSTNAYGDRTEGWA